MIIRRFVRTDSTTIPGKCISVLELDAGDSGGVNVASVTNTLRGDKDSLDGIAIYSADWSVIGDNELQSLLISLKPLRTEMILIATGGHPERVDDVMGSGYIDILDLTISDRIDRNQMRYIEIVERYEYRFIVSVDLVPGIMDADKLREIAECSKGCEMFVMRVRPPVNGGKPFRKKDLESMIGSVKGAVRNPKLV